jgi:hypothetical protein
MAALQRDLAWRHGWRIVPEQVTATRAVVRIRRDDRPMEGGTVVAFTMEDAERAGLPRQNPTYKTYPDRMLFARASTKAISLVCPEVLFEMSGAGVVDVVETAAINATSRDAVPPDVYDSGPEASASEPEDLRFDPDDILDPTRPFTE